MDDEEEPKYIPRPPEYNKNPNATSTQHFPPKYGYARYPQDIQGEIPRELTKHWIDASYKLLPLGSTPYTEEFDRFHNMIMRDQEGNKSTPIVQKVPHIPNDPNSTKKRREEMKGFTNDHRQQATIHSAQENNAKVKQNFQYSKHQANELIRLLKQKSRSCPM